MKEIAKFLLVLLAVLVTAQSSSAHGGETASHHKPKRPCMLDAQFCHRDMSTLRMLIMVARHGDSTPDMTFPTDVYQEATWRNGFAQLTRNGVERSFQLGKWTRECYGGALLRKVASPQRVYVRSSSLDKTLQSAQAYLAGAYPPATSLQLWGDTCPINVGEVWLPYAVHTVPAKWDDLLLGYTNCPRFDEITRQIGMSKSMQNFLLLNDKYFVRKLMHKSGIDSDDFLHVVKIVQSAVFAAMENDRQPVEWLHGEEDLNKLIYYRDLITDLYFNHPKLAKMAAGVLMKTILDRLQQKAESKTSLEHIFYSADENVLSGLLGSMGILSEIGHVQPSYASAIIFELHQFDDTYAVSMFYRNSTKHQPLPLAIEGCLGFTLDEISHSADIISTKNRRHRRHDSDSGSSFGGKFDDSDSDESNKKAGSDSSSSDDSNGSSGSNERYSTDLVFYKLKNLQKAFANKTSVDHEADCASKANKPKQRQAGDQRHRQNDRKTTRHEKRRRDSDDSASSYYVKRVKDNSHKDFSSGASHSSSPAHSEFSLESYDSRSRHFRDKSEFDSRFSYDMSDTASRSAYSQSYDSRSRSRSVKDRRPRKYDYHSDEYYLENSDVSSATIDVSRAAGHRHQPWQLRPIKQTRQQKHQHHRQRNQQAKPKQQTKQHIHRQAVKPKQQTKQHIHRQAVKPKQQTKQQLHRHRQAIKSKQQTKKQHQNHHHPHQQNPPQQQQPQQEPSSPNVLRPLKSWPPLPAITSIDDQKGDNKPQQPKNDETPDAVNDDQ